MAYLHIYSKVPAGVEYPTALAYSIHMSISKDKEQFIKLNRDYGILFPEAEIREDGTLSERGVMNPVLLMDTVTKDHSFVIAANLVQEGKEVPRQLRFWISKDLVHFSEYKEEKGMTSSEYPFGCRMEVEQLVAEQRLKNKAGIYEIEDEVYEALYLEYMPVCHVANDIPRQVTVSKAEELQKIGIDAIYSDGSKHHKRVNWEVRGIDFNTPGTYQIPGRIQQKIFRFPLAKGFADPVVFFYDNKWYFISTNDNTDDIGIFVREAEKVEDLFGDHVRMSCILPQDKSRGLVQTFWAPEFHIVGSRLYILFAVGGEAWAPQSHVMRLKEGGSIMCEADWEDPVRVHRMDGKPLNSKGITLDMTTFCANGKRYAVWSERYDIGTPKDSGSMLYIATLDMNDPSLITSEPVLLSRPLYGWENQAGTINNEGAYALLTEDKVYLAYSGGSAGGYSYVVGYLTADINADLLDPSVWNKSQNPELSSFSVSGEYGPGHNSFYKDETGDTYIAYHAKEKSGFQVRSTAIRRVHFNAEGKPLLGMTIEQDLEESLANISMEVKIK